MENIERLEAWADHLVRGIVKDINWPKWFFCYLRGHKWRMRRVFTGWYLTDCSRCNATRWVDHV